MTKTPSLEESDRIGAAGATARRVSLESMKAKIKAEYFLNAYDAVHRMDIPVVDDLKMLTICLIVMRNGFVLIGKSAPVSAANFDAEKGRIFAYEDALRQLWPLEGYALREELG